MPGGRRNWGVGTYPLKTIFPVEFMHKNCTIDRGHQTLLICKEKNYSFTVSKWRPFENFRFTSLRNTPKFEEPLSQKSFWQNLAEISRLSKETNIWNKIVKIFLKGDFIGKTNFAVRDQYANLC